MKKHMPDAEKIKICAICGETVQQNAIECPSCGKGVFETEKRVRSVNMKTVASAPSEDKKWWQFWKRTGQDPSLMNQANLMFICKNPGESETEIYDNTKKMDTILQGFKRKFPGRLTNVPKVRAIPGVLLDLTMTVYYKDFDDLQRMKAFVDKKIVKRGLADL